MNITPPAAAPSPLRAALIGYGNAGRIFHAPLISGVPELQLASVVSSKPEAVQADWPGLPVVSTPQAAFADPSINLVVIATGNLSHHPLAREALLAGKHVVVDKPFTVTLAQAEDLLALARSQQRTITVFQNRRWDADFLALQQVLASGELGRIVHFESHYDRFRPLVLNRWRDDDLPGSGLWFDLGAHLLDQALQLFGCPDDMQLDLAAQRDEARTNDYFHAQLRYGGRNPALRVILHGGSLVSALGPRFAVHGTRGSFVKYGMDTQEDALKAGARPQWGKLSNWGRDPQLGQITQHEGAEIAVRPAPDVAGNYLAFYAQLAVHLRAAQANDVPVPPPVTPAEAHRLIALLVRGGHSAGHGQRLDTSDLKAGETLQTWEIGANL